MYKGQHIKTRKNAVYRPTQDRVRAAVFDHLGDAILGARVLDLFCGTGALGIDALSRGAGYVVFCDKANSAIQTTTDNLHTIGIPTGQFEVIRADALSVCSRLAARGDRYDVVFMDPPYKTLLYNAVLVALDSSGIISDNGIVVVEHSKVMQLPQITGVLQSYTYKRYGDTMVTYYRRGK